MKASYNWLKEYVAFDENPQDLSDLLTMTGLEVEGLDEVGGIEGNLEGVVIGHVQSVKQHPNADKLRICLVDVGQAEPLSIVCGAPNVAEGQKVPVATVGTKLYPFHGDGTPFKIKKGKIRGEVSLGMICAEDELGLGESHDGIMVLDPNIKQGTPFNQVAKLDKDHIFEIALTPNRIDGGSHYGVARDIAAVKRSKAKLPKITLKTTELSAENPISITIEDENRCKRYIGIYLENVTVEPSPEWLQKRLTNIGLRPINNIVDITNFVMMELGQPLHAFDADQISGKQIIVKTLSEDHKFTTLDEQERQLIANQDLMICDAERGLCIAGVMGGLNSGVSEKTQNIFLESAYFESSTVRKTSKRLALASDSSFRFERGVDPNMTDTAALRAAELITQIAGGKAIAYTDLKKADSPHFELTLSLALTHKLMGIEISKQEVTEILQALDIEVQNGSNEDELALKVPPFRVDVTRQQDVIEEILRIYGYNNIPIPQKLNSALNFRQYKDTSKVRQGYADYLSANGFYEIMTNSLVSKERANEQAVLMLNPLSEEQGAMRQTLLHGGLEAIEYNQNRQNPNLAFYEFGKTYQNQGGTYQEHAQLAIWITGNKTPAHYEVESKAVSLQTLSREVERLQAWLGFKGELQETEHPEMSYALALNYRKKPVLWYGKVKAELTGDFNIRNEVFYLIADWESLLDIYFATKVEFQEIPQFPSTSRDISMLLDESIAFADIQKAVEKCNPKLIQEVKLMDVYQGEKVAEGKKSYLISITFLDMKKTINDKAADKITQKARQVLEKEFGASIR